MSVWPQIRINVKAIRNDFFGERITVSGLITGQDLVAQLKGTDIGKALLITGNMLRHGEEVFLDDMTLTQVREELGCEVVTVGQDDGALLEAVLSVASYR